MIERKSTTNDIVYCLNFLLILIFMILSTIQFWIEQWDKAIYAMVWAIFFQNVKIQMDMENHGR